MKTVELPVVITQDEDGYFVAEVPVIPSCFTQGKTKEEALENIKEVIDLCIEALQQDGWSLPEEYFLEHVQVEVGVK